MNLYETVEHLLRSNPNFVGENDEILKTKVSEAVTNLDPYLVKIFKNNDLTRQVFFQQLEDVWVLNQEKLKWVVNAKEFLEDSYTSYTNEIGLTSAGKFLSANNDVVLDFPYKDAVLVGGQDKDDQKRQEIMYHEVIGYDQITNLKAPKVFANAKRYTADGVEEDIAFTDDDNLIIKGNNYAALNSLLERYRGKIKLIYIDPPYNTGGDSFHYNDKFNHSTWLTFMKNRLEIACELLSNDGSLWINIDDDEAHYLKVLIDLVFGRENFLGNIIWKKKYSPQNDAKYFSDMHDHILVFAKNKEQFKINGLPRNSEMDSRYTNRDNDPRGVWKAADLSVRRITEKDRYPITTPSGRVVYPPEGRSWVLSKENFQKHLEDNRIWFGENGNNVPSVKKFLNEVKDTVTPQTIWDYSEVGHNQEAIQNLNKLFNESIFTTSKPERLLQRIIHIGSNEKDLVLDFFMGSATTQAVAHKMGRQYIGIEQMDYINTVSVPRLQKVIEGEQGGISKDVDWKGGGSFVYCELLEDGQRLIDKIQSASSETIQSVKDEIYRSEQIVPYILTSDLEKAEKDFNALTLDEQKQALIGLIDKNKLYVNYSSIDDEDYQISKADKKFSRSFYEGGEVHD